MAASLKMVYSLVNCSKAQGEIVCFAVQCAPLRSRHSRARVQRICLGCVFVKETMFQSFQRSQRKFSKLDSSQFPVLLFSVSVHLQVSVSYTGVIKVKTLHYRRPRYHVTGHPPITLWPY